MIRSHPLPPYSTLRPSHLPPPMLLPTFLSTASSLSSPSSSPVSPSIAYPPSSSTSSSPSPRLTRTYVPASGRKARRAAKHRGIDLTRRTRESTALAQLKQLLSLSVANNSNNSAVGDGTPLDVSASVSRSNGATDTKAAVLENLVAEVIRLHKVIAVQRAMLTGLMAPLRRPVHPPLPHAHSSD